MVKKNSNGYRYAQIFLKRIRNLELKRIIGRTMGKNLPEEWKTNMEISLRHIWDAVLRY